MESVKACPGKALLLRSRDLALRPLAEDMVKAFKAKFEPEPRRIQLRGDSSHILDDEKGLVSLEISADQDRFAKVVHAYYP